MSRGKGLTRAGLALPSLLFIAGTLVLLFLLILAGAYDSNPLNRIFFLQADTSGIPNAPQGLCHWTLYNFCDERNGKNYNCGSNRAAYPFVPQENFDTKTNIPANFLNNRDTYFYLSRFLYAFYIISIFCTTFAFLLGLAALCAGIGGLLSALCSSLALFCVTFCATIMTACFVLGQKAFKADGRFARVGVKAFAFTWTTVALTFLATIGFFLSYLAHKRKGRSRYVSNDSPKKTGGFGMGSRMFRRNNKTAAVNGNRNSAYSDAADSQQRMNKEYAT